jgi:tripartite-type tricarboxylate transporter receptor subunit TctC
MRMLRSCLFAIASSIALIASAGAQEYPSKPITIVVPFPAGGPFEVVRHLATHIEARWGKPVVIDNRAGAGGLIGAQTVSRASPDGYTMLFVGASVASLKVLVKDATFDPVSDLAPVSMFVDFPSGFVTNTQTPAKTVDEFVSWVKASPGKVNYGSVGPNASMLVIEAFKRAAGIEMIDIPYSGGAQTMTGLLRNDVQFIGAPLNKATKQQVDEGKVTPLVVIGGKRARSFPAVPTTEEKGYNIPRNGWSALFAPPGTPKPIRDKWAAEVAEYAKTAAAAKLIEDLGVEVGGSSPEELGRQVASDARMWGEIANAIGFKPQ